MKTCFAVVTLMFILGSANLFGQTASAPIYGDGSEELPYVIISLENLYWIAEDSSRWDDHYVQMSDIDASSATVISDALFANDEPFFTGVYDGQGYSIGNLPCTIFGNLRSGSVISNLHIDNCDITGGLVGGLANFSYGTITNCSVTGTISGSNWIGGLVGNTNNSTISNCHVNVIVTGTTTHSGGLIGVSIGGAISNCYSKGSVTSPEGQFSGGLVGWNIDATITNCYSAAEVACNSPDQEGLVGNGDPLDVTNSFWDIGTSLQTNNYGGTGKTTAEMQNVETFTSIATFGLDTPWDFVGNPNDDTGIDDYWDINSSTNGNYPFLVDPVISFKYDLFTLQPSNILQTTAKLNGVVSKQSITQYGFCWSTSSSPTLDDSFIDLGSIAPANIYTYNLTGLDHGQTYYYRAFMASDREIIYGDEISFHTTLNGSGTVQDPYQISNLENLYMIRENNELWDCHFIQVNDIDASSAPAISDALFANDEPYFTGVYDGQGYSIENLPCTLFGLLESGSEISNLHIEDCNITGSLAGGLVNTSFGTITNCSVTGTISGSNWIGGLVGNTNNSTISNCYVNVDVTCTWNFTGGLVGTSLGGAISNCYSKGSVVSPVVSYSGGLVGWNVGTTISNCYSTVEVGGTSPEHGGLVGNGEPLDVTNSFWDTETSDQSTSAGGTGKTPAEMTTDALAVNYVYNIYLANSWDFKGETTNGSDRIWNIGNGRNDGYPYFDWQFPDDPPTLSMAPSAGDGSSGSPFQISDWQNLLWLIQNSAEWNKHFIQTADIDLTSAIPVVSEWDEGAGWTPIGNETTKFTGTYYGQDHTIDGLFIERTSSNLGLFGYTNAANIQNLGLTNADITSIGGNAIGVLVGVNFNSSISDCYSTGSVTDQIGWATGGLVGDSRDNSSITNSYSSCTVNGDGNAGGFIGFNFNGSTVINCYCTGQVSCVGTSNHSGAGGFVGLNQNATISKSYSTGNVNGKDNAGGFAGFIYYATVSNCYSKGNITRLSGTNTNYGGFAGYLVTNNTISCCYSTGSVFQSDGVGWADETKGFVGGEDDSNTYTADFFNSEVSNQSTAIGATAETTDNMKAMSIYDNAGWDFDTIWSMISSYNDGYPNLDGESDDPLPVTLTNFDVSFPKTQIVLHWLTESETDNLGFNLYRSESENGFEDEDYFKINSVLINGMGTTSVPTNYSFIDEYPSIEGHTYWYWLESVSATNELELFGPVSLEIPFTSQLPTMTILNTNYPNPFNPETTIAFSIKENEVGVLSIFNLKGEKIIEKEFETGEHQYNWNAEHLASGIYFYKLSSPTTNITKKMILMK